MPTQTDVESNVAPSGSMTPDAATANAFAGTTESAYPLWDFINPASIPFWGVAAIGMAAGILLGFVAHRIAITQREAVRWIVIASCIVLAVGTVYVLERSSNAYESTPVTLDDMRSRGKPWHVAKPDTGIEGPELTGSYLRKNAAMRAIEDRLSELEAYRSNDTTHDLKIVDDQSEANASLVQLEKRLRQLQEAPVMEANLIEIEKEIEQIRNLQVGQAMAACDRAPSTSVVAKPAPQYVSPFAGVPPVTGVICPPGQSSAPATSVQIQSTPYQAAFPPTQVTPNVVSPNTTYPPVYIQP